MNDLSIGLGNFLLDLSFLFLVAHVVAGGLAARKIGGTGAWLMVVSGLCQATIYVIRNLNQSGISLLDFINGMPWFIEISTIIGVLAEGLFLYGVLLLVKRIAPGRSGRDDVLDSW